MLELKNLTFWYDQKSKKEILSNVNAEFVEGKIYSILGASGSGKTTLLSLIGGLDMPSNGSIYIDGIDTQKIKGYMLRRKYASYVFQNYLLLEYLTSLENVTTALDICHSEENKKEYAKKLLMDLGLKEDEIKRSVKKLSGGQQQRVAIARALSVKSNYILADEPTGNLDKSTATEIIDILENLAKKSGKCVIVATHSSYISERSDFVYSIEEGALSLID